MSNLGLQNNNPGNLRDPNTGQFRVFSTPQEGQQALMQDLQAKQSGQSSHIKPGASIEDLGNVWAPDSDNNTGDNWATNVAKYLGVPTAYAFDKVPTDQLAKAVQVAEGTSTMNMNQTDTQSNAQQTSQPATQSSKPQLTHEQLIENINAMEQQGAKPQEVQSYLDSLKQDQSGMSQSDIDKQNLTNQGYEASSTLPTPQPSTQQSGQPEMIQGAIQGIASPFLKMASSVRSGVDLGKSIYGQLTGNQGLEQNANQDYNQGNSQGYSYGGFLGQAKPIQNIGDALSTGANAGSTLVAVAGGVGLLQGIMRSGTALISPYLEDALSTSAEKFASSDPVGKLNILKESLDYADDAENSMRGSQVKLLTKAIDEITPAAEKAMNLNPGILKTILTKAPGLAWKTIRTLAEMGGVAEMARGGIDVKKLLGIQ